MNLSKVLTVIAGFSTCSDYNYACYIAENLSDSLPNFSVKKITINFSDWKNWLTEKCEKNKWSHSESPLVWREPGVCGGDISYIGGSKEFKDFIQNYYGINVEFNDKEKEALNLDYLLVQNKELSDDAQEFKSNTFRITISGAGRTVTPDLVAQLAMLPNLQKCGVSICLYDLPGHFFKIKDIVKDAKGLAHKLCSVTILDNISDGLKECDLLICLEDLSREEFESTESWLTRNYEAMKALAEKINIYASPSMKVIFCSMGPNCFSANALVKEATILDKNNVVVVSAHYGLELLYDFTKTINISLKEISCPPVWGFLGVNHYVDIHHITHKASVYIPNKRALTNYENSTLPLGIKYSELRWLFYLSFDKKPFKSLQHRKSICLYQVGRTEDFQKCKAIIDLIKLWFRKDSKNLEDIIITLGISSDGTFGIPKGVYFSQPVHLKILEDNSRVWVPCSEFPLPHEELFVVENCMVTAKHLLKKIGIID